ncbi:MAG: PorT family protein [Chitinophagales bacterium]|nr:PorT family protein [Chitinophagales bacterium]
MIKSFILLASLLLTINVYSQNSDDARFRGGLILGFNATQIDGDDMGGFKKFGLNSGAIVYFVLDERFSISTSLLYSQKGAKSSFNTKNSFSSRKIIIDYVDIPIQFNYHDKEIAIFSGGIALGRLVRYKQFVGGIPIHDTDPNPYSDWSLSAVANVTFLIKQQFGVNIHFQYSVLSLGERFDESNFKNRGQYNNILGLRTMYFFN